MIRSAVQQHRTRAAWVTAIIWFALIVVACETPLPQDPPQDTPGANVVAGTDIDGRLATAVESGWITRAQADEVKADVAGTVVLPPETADVGETIRKEALRTSLELELRSFGGQIRKTIGAGTMTGDEARAAYGSYRELMGLPAVQRSRSVPVPQDREADMREIRGAVEAGEMTAEAGRARSCRIRAGAALDAGEVTRDGVRPMYQKCVSGAHEETRRR